MTTNAAFSFYDWVVHAANAEQVSIRRLVDTKSAAATKDGQLTTSARAMLHWCSVIEQLTIDRHASSARVCAGFERTSRIRSALRRYQHLSASIQRLVIFGELDQLVELDAEFVDVAGCALAREWFLVVHSPNYAALLVARDLDGFSATGPLAQRRFVGVTLSGRSFVEAAVHRLEQQVSALRG